LNHAQIEPSGISEVGITKINPDGQTLWKQILHTDTIRKVAEQVIQTSDLGFAMVGQKSVVPGEDADMYLVRTDSAGNLLWEQQYGGSNFDAGSSLVQTPDSGFLLLGWTRSFGAGQRDFYLVKTDSLGNQEWQRTFGGGGDELGWSMLSLNDGNFLLTGMGSYGSNASIGRMYKVNPLGVTLWSKTYVYSENKDNNLYRTIELPNGELVSAGLTDRFSNNNSGWLLKTDSAGNVLWQREYDYNSNTDLFYTLIATSDGGFLLGGQAKHDWPLTQDAWLLKVDSVGCPYPDCLVGIDEAEPSKVVVDVWPNPASEVVRLHPSTEPVLSLAEGLRVTQVSVIDMQGRVFEPEMTVHEGEMGQYLETDVRNWSDGLYIFTINNGTDRARVRVVVQH
jgi:hypothetical protein